MVKRVWKTIGLNEGQDHVVLAFCTSCINGGFRVPILFVVEFLSCERSTQQSTIVANYVVLEEFTVLLYVSMSRSRS